MSMQRKNKNFNIVKQKPLSSLACSFLPNTHSALDWKPVFEQVDGRTHRSHQATAIQHAHLLPGVAHDLRELLHAPQNPAEHLQVRGVAGDQADVGVHRRAQAHAPPSSGLLTGQRVRRLLPVHRIVLPIGNPTSTSTPRGPILKCGRLYGGETRTILATISNRQFLRWLFRQSQRPCALIEGELPASAAVNTSSADAEIFPC